MSYSQLLRDSHFHQTSTSASEQEWTTQCHYNPETNGSRGVVMDCAPLPYHAVVSLSQPKNDCSRNSTMTACFNYEDPPPYPG